MNAFDPRSIILISFFIVLLQAIVLVALSGAISRQIVGLRLGAVAAGLWAAGGGLVIVRGVAPDAASVYLGNLCLSGAAIVLLGALRDFDRDSVTSKSDLGAASLCYAVALWVAFASGSYEHLLMTITGFNAGAYVFCALACRRQALRGFAPAFLFSSLIFAFLVSLGRFATLFMDIESPAHFYDTINLQRLYLGLVALSIISVLLAYTLVAYDRARTLLERSNLTLETEVQARTAQLTLEIARQRELEREVSVTAEAERRRVGRELHDDLGQRLTGMSLVSEAIHKELAEENPALARHAEAIQIAASEAIAQVRRLAHGLMPVGLDAGDLSSALRELARSTSLGGVVCDFECEQEGAALRDPDVATNLYRIAQEAVTNAVRHGRATRVKIHLGVVDGRSQLSVEDNGSGFDVEEVGAVAQGAGLGSIQFRASVIDFNLAISSSPGIGSAVTVTERQAVV